ncbi:hypothetical protein CKO27_13480 [Thiocystis violacea]|nr:hypothetical protein [Thiocystis violacea]
MHPFNLTSVLYIVQRQAELSALFALLSMLLYSLARQRQIEGRPGAPLFYALLPISFIMGIFSKENGVLIPGYLFLLEICFFRFRAQRPAVTAWLKRICLTAIVLALPLALYAFYHFGSYQHRDFTLTERLLTQSRVIWFYLQSILLPDIRAMTIFHDDFQLSRSLLDPASTLFAIGGVAFLVGAAVALRKRAPVLSFGILFYFMSHALESTFIALEMVHEHRNYLGSWGLIWAFFHYFFVFAYRYQRKGIAIALSCAIIGVLAVNTRIRADYWSNELLLVEYHVHHHPASFRSLVSAGGAYASYGNALRNEEALRKALDYYHRADQLRPSTSAPLIAIVGLLVVLGEEDQLPKYEIRLAENLSQRPIDTETMNAFVVVSRCLGKVKDCTFPQRVYRNMAESLLRNPNLNNVNSQTAAQIYSANSNFAYMDGHIEQALAYNENALKIHPTDLQHWLNQAMLLGMAGRTADAMAQLDKARGIDTTSYGRERIDAVARQLTQN